MFVVLARCNPFLSCLDRDQLAFKTICRQASRDTSTTPPGSCRRFLLTYAILRTAIATRTTCRPRISCSTPRTRSRPPWANRRQAGQLEQPLSALPRWWNGPGRYKGAAEQGGVVTRLDEEKALMSRCRDHSSWRSVERLAVTPPDAPRRIERKSPCNPPCDKGDGDVSPAAINTVREPVRLCSAAEKGTPKEPEGVAAATFLLGAPPRGALT
jgi:hypothetical protein